MSYRTGGGIGDLESLEVSSEKFLCHLNTATNLKSIKVNGWGTIQQLLVSNYLMNVLYAWGCKKFKVMSVTTPDHRIAYAEIPANFGTILDLDHDIYMESALQKHLQGLERDDILIATDSGYIDGDDRYLMPLFRKSEYLSEDAKVYQNRVLLVTRVSGENVTGQLKAHFWILKDGISVSDWDLAKEMTLFTV